MTFARWQAHIVDDSGDVQSSATVEVRNEADGTLAPLYADRSGSTPKANPFNADANGYAFFHAPGGAYRITATKDAFSTEWRYVGVGLGGESDGGGLGADAVGDEADLSTYDAEEQAFVFVAQDTFRAYIKASNTSADWSDPIELRGPPGDPGESAIDYSTALARLDGREGIWFHFAGRAYAIRDYATTLNDAGTPADILTIARASNGSYMDRDGVLKTASSNVIRYDYNTPTGRPGLMCEGARTNYALRSEEFDNGWSIANFLAFGAGSTADAIVAPDGTTTADNLVVDTATGPRSVFRNAAVAPNQTLAQSVWVNTGAALKRIRLEIQDAASGSNRVQADFDAGTLTVSGVTNNGNATGAAGYFEVWPGGWIRCVLTGKPNTSGSSSLFVIRVLDASGNSSYTGDGVSNCVLWGAQLEPGYHASSYIKTTTAAVARAADSYSMAASLFPVDVDNASIFLTASVRETIQAVGQVPVLLYSTSLTTNSAWFQVNAAGALGALTYSGGVQQSNQSLGSPTDNTEFKAGMSWRRNRVRAKSSLGAAPADDTVATSPAALGTLYIGSDNAGIVPFFGHIYDLGIVVRQESAAEIAAYTG